MRIDPTDRKLVASLAVLVVLGMAAPALAQFVAPTCVPPSCNPTVIQNIDIAAGAQTASINVTGDAKLGATFQAGANNPILTAATSNLMYGNVSGSSTNGSLLLLQFGLVDRLRVTLAGQMQLPLGSAAAPSYSFVGDTNTGLYSSAADTFSFVTGGTARTTINNSGTTINSGVLSLPSGSAAAPSLTFTGDTNTGLYRTGADSVALVTNGVARETIDSAGTATFSGNVVVNGTFSGGGTISGSGSSNYLPKFSGASTVGNSEIYDDGTVVTLGQDMRLFSKLSAANGYERYGIGYGIYWNDGAGNYTVTDTTYTQSTFSDENGTFTWTNHAGALTSPQTYAGWHAYDRMRLDSSGNLTLLTGNLAVSSGTISGNGSGITNINASNISGGTLNPSTLPSNVAYTDANQTFTGANTFSNASNSFTGSGSGLTSLNATQLTSGTVPSARISGTYSNALTFSNRTSFGSASLNVTSGNSLIFGNVDTASAGYLLRLQNESVDAFTVDVFGNVTTNGSITAGPIVASSLTVGGNPVLTGSGSTNYVPKWSGASTLGTSALYDDGGGNIGIGTSSPSAKLTVNGSISGTSLSTYMVAAGAAGITGQVVGVGSYGVVGAGDSYGVYGSSGGYGIYGFNSSAGASGAGVYGYGSGTSPGVQGTSAAGWGGSFSSLYVTPGTAYFASGANMGFGTLLLANLGSAPSGANGAMYYDTGLSSFRCYTGGAWGGCGVGGSGTTNYVAKFTGTSSIGNSLIQDNGTGVSIGGTPAGTALTVVGPTNLSNALIATTNANNGVGIYGFGLGTSSIGVYGQGVGSGVSGVGGGASGVGLQGTGNYSGVTGTTASQWGYGVLGTVPSNSYVYGVYGITASSQYTSAGVAGVNSGNGMGGYFQSNNATTYALLAYNGGSASGYAFQAQGVSNFTGAVTMNSSLNVAGFTYLGDAAADQVTINAATLNIPNNLNIDSNTMYLDAANNRIGLGTSSPQAAFKLTVNDDGTNGGIAVMGDGVGDLRIRLDNNTTTDGYIFQQAAKGNDLTIESSQLRFNTNGANERMLIDSSGNVGIGYDPSYKLDVNGRAFFNGEIAVGGDISSVWTGYGVASSGTSAGGHFYNTLYPSVYGALGYQYSTDRYGVYGSAIDGSAGTTYAGYFTASGGTSYGVYANGSSYGVYANGSSYGLRANASTYGVYSTATYAGYFSGSGGAYAYTGYNSNYGVYAGAPGSGIGVYGYNGSTGYGVYASGGYYGVYGQGAVRGGDFYDTSGTAHTFIAGASWGVEIVTGGAVKPGGGSWSSSSDRRVKKDVSDFKDGLSVIRQMNPVNYTYNGLGETPEGQKGIGFIAQDVQKVAPYLIQHESKKLHPEDAEDTDILLVDPSAIPFININAIKELDLRIDGYEAKVETRLDEAEARIKTLEQRVERLESQLDAQK